MKHKIESYGKPSRQLLVFDENWTWQVFFFPSSYVEESTKGEMLVANENK